MHRAVDHRNAKRTLANFTRLAVLVDREKAQDPNRRSVTAELLCAGRHDRLPRVDWLGTFDRELVARMLESLTDDQKQVESLLRAMPAGIALIFGPAGSSKSTVLDYLV